MHAPAHAPVGQARPDLVLRRGSFYLMGVLSGGAEPALSGGPSKAAIGLPDSPPCPARPNPLPCNWSAR
jgi:hypothetical protein